MTYIYNHTDSIVTQSVSLNLSLITSKTYIPDSVSIDCYCGLVHIFHIFLCPNNIHHLSNRRLSMKHTNIHKKAWETFSLHRIVQDEQKGKLFHSQLNPNIFFT